MNVGIATDTGAARWGFGFASDIAGLIGLALVVPFAMLAFGLPLVLLIKALLWVFGAQ